MRKSILALYLKMCGLFKGYGLGDFYLIRVINKIIIYFISPGIYSTVINGQKMYIHSKDSIMTPRLLINGEHDPTETDLIMNEVNEGDIVLDIGANIGYFTLIFAKLVGEKGKVYAFEPDPENFSLLKKNVEENGHKNVVLLQKAVSSENGTIKLYLSEENKGNHRIFDSQRGRKSIDVETVKLDDFFKNYSGDINFVKIDVEGAEIGAIQGMSGLLQKYNNIKMITEFHPHGIEEYGHLPEDYLDLLRGYDFELYNINEEKKLVEPVNVPELLQVFATNIWCVKKRHSS